jgi:hypothetical protein
MDVRGDAEFRTKNADPGQICGRLFTLSLVSCATSPFPLAYTDFFHYISSVILWLVDNYRK